MVKKGCGFSHGKVNCICCLKDRIRKNILPEKIFKFNELVIVIINNDSLVISWNKVSDVLVLHQLLVHLLLLTTQFLQHSSWSLTSSEVT